MSKLIKFLSLIMIFVALPYIHQAQDRLEPLPPARVGTIVDISGTPLLLDPSSNMVSKLNLSDTLDFGDIILLPNNGQDWVTVQCDGIDEDYPITNLISTFRCRGGIVYSFVGNPFLLADDGIMPIEIGMIIDEGQTMLVEEDESVRIWCESSPVDIEPVVSPGGGIDCRLRNIELPEVVPEERLYISVEREHYLGPIAAARIKIFFDDPDAPEGSAPKPKPIPICTLCMQDEYVVNFGNGWGRIPDFENQYEDFLHGNEMNFFCAFQGTGLPNYNIVPVNPTNPILTLPGISPDNLLYRYDCFDREPIVPDIYDDWFDLQPDLSSEILPPVGLVNPELWYNQRGQSTFGVIPSNELGDMATVLALLNQQGINSSQLEFRWSEGVFSQELGSTTDWNQFALSPIESFNTSD